MAARGIDWNVGYRGNGVDLLTAGFQGEGSSRWLIGVWVFHLTVLGGSRSPGRHAELWPGEWSAEFNFLNFNFFMLLAAPYLLHIFVIVCY